MLRFHTKTGINIELRDEGKSALRIRSFSNAIAFSNRPLGKDETFLFEIEDHEPGWAGHVRCGVTLHNPKLIDLPQYLLPDLMQLGKSWVFAIKPSIESPFGDQHVNSNIPIVKCQSVSASNIHPDLLVNTQFEGCSPTGKGSRIGLHVTKGGSLYFIINGVQYGPCVTDIPGNVNNLYAVMDLYGMTKKLRIIHGTGKYLQVIALLLFVL